MNKQIVYKNSIHQKNLNLNIIKNLNKKFNNVYQNIILDLNTPNNVYNTLSKKSNGINITDTKNLYLAYHEGQGGFRRKTYASKSSLINTPSLKRWVTSVIFTTVAATAWFGLKIDSSSKTKSEVKSFLTE